MCGQNQFPELQKGGLDSLETLHIEFNTPWENFCSPSYRVFPSGLTSGRQAPEQTVVIMIISLLELHAMGSNPAL